MTRGGWIYAVTAAVAGFSLWRWTTCDRRAVAALEARDMVLQVVAGLDQAESAQRGYLLTGRADYLSPRFGAGEDAALTALARLRALADGDQALQARVAVVRREVDAKLAEMRETVTRMERGDKAGAYSIVESDRGRRQMERVREAAAEMLAEHDGAVAAARGDRNVAVVGGWVVIVLVAAGSVSAAELEAAAVRRREKEMIARARNGNGHPG